MDSHRECNPVARVYVGNIDYSTTFDDLKKMFGKYGPIKDLYMPLVPNPEKSGSLQNRGFAFIEFEDARDALDAVDASRDLKGINGRELKVSIAEPRD